MAYFVSTCGTTVRHQIDYRSCYEDGYGNPTFKLLPRPSIAHFVYEFLPLIDEHNKARQSILALEDKWPTKCCWFRLITTFVGMAVVDLQRWDRNMRSGSKGIAESRVWSECEDVQYNFNIMRMCDLIGRALSDGTLSFYDDKEEERRASKSPRMSQNEHARAAAGIEHAQLIRYKKNGELNNSKGKAYQRYCYICRTHGETCNTQWMCSRCEMPLCKKERRGEEWSCLHEHMHTVVGDDACGPVRNWFKVPDTSLKVRLTSAQNGNGNKRRRDRISTSNNRASTSTLTPPPPPPPPPPPRRGRSKILRRHPRADT